MELFCALLTGFFLWLFVYHWRRKSIERMRQLAGDLLFMAGSTRPRRVRWTLFIYLSVILLINVVGVLAGPLLNAHVTFDLGGQCGLAVTFAAVLALGIPATRNIALEVREHGVLCQKVGSFVPTGRLYFVPWNQIAACQWVRKSFGVISKFDDVHNSLTIAQNCVPSEQKHGVTIAIGQFVVVYNYDGYLLAEPGDEARKTKWISHQSLDHPPLQFNLQTMLLLVVVVACFANLVGLHYRNPKTQAIRRLGTLDPAISFNGDDEVWKIDFSGCVKKPTDDDLVYLEPLSELEFLDLGGAPITDAGLMHLKGLKKLTHLNLANTGVTEKGMEDLWRWLPKTSIAKRVQWIPPNMEPIYSLPPKGKRRP